MAVIPREAAPQQLLSNILLCKGSVRELEALCPHNDIKACRVVLMSITPAAQKHSLTPIGLRINLDFLLPRTNPVPCCRQICTAGKAVQTSLQTLR